MNFKISNIPGNSVYINNMFFGFFMKKVQQCITKTKCLKFYKHRKLMMPQQALYRIFTFFYKSILVGIQPVFEKYSMMVKSEWLLY